MGASAIECRRCQLWVSLIQLVVNPHTQIAHCPRCGTPIASVGEIARVAGRPVEELFPATTLASRPIEAFQYDTVFTTWPAGEQGERLREMQAAGELVVIDEGLQAANRYGIIVLHGGGDRGKRRPPDDNQRG